MLKDLRLNATNPSDWAQMDHDGKVTSSSPGYTKTKTKNGTLLLLSLSWP